MATRVFETLVLELQDGSEVTIRPLSIKKLRKFMEVIKKLEDAEDEISSVNILVDACAIAVSVSNLKLSEDKEALEDALDVPTMYKILEVAGGVKLNDPNLTAAGLVGMN